MSVLEGIRRPKKSNKVSPLMRAFTNVLIFSLNGLIFLEQEQSVNAFFLRSFLRNFTLGFSLCFIFLFCRYRFLAQRRCCAQFRENTFVCRQKFAQYG